LCLALSLCVPVCVCVCVCREFPGQLQKILEWFRDYKIPDGKPANAFGYDNKCMDKEFTLKVRTGRQAGSGVTAALCLLACLLCWGRH